MIFSKKQKLQKGFSLVEVIVGVSIMTVSLISVLSLAQKSIVVSRQGLHELQAGYLLEEGAEAVKTVRDGGWSNISGLSTSSTYYPKFSSGAWSLTTTSSDGTVDVFTRSVMVASVNRDSNDDIATSGTADTGSKKVTVTVSWSESGTTITKTLQLYVFDIFS